MHRDEAADSLHKFYTSLLKQNPQSEMAIRYCLKHKLNHHIKSYAHGGTLKSILMQLESKKNLKTIRKKDCKKSKKSQYHQNNKENKRTKTKVDEKKEKKKNGDTKKKKQKESKKSNKKKDDDKKACQVVKKFNQLEITSK